MPVQPLPMKRMAPKTESEKAREQKVARITRQIQLGVYYVPGKEIARKFLLASAS